MLRGLDAVRKRPGMYIGDTDDGSGSITWSMRSSIIPSTRRSPAIATASTVALNGDGSVTVRDNGRGIPVDIHQEEGVSAAEVIMTQLHAGGKFDQNSYKVSGGLHGVGVSVVNALSETARSAASGATAKTFHALQDGDPEAPLAVVGDAGDRAGTEITFLPSAKQPSPRSSSTTPRWSTGCANSPFSIPASAWS